MSLAELPYYQFVAPQNLNDATILLADAVGQGLPVWPIAGCTDWMVERHAGPLPDHPVRGLAIDISRVPQLLGISQQGSVIRIGAAETMMSIQRNALLAQQCPILVEMASQVGAPQIQARATLGGNLVSASPAADGVTVLFALDAIVVLASRNQERSVPISTFYTGYRATVRHPDEIVVRFEFQAPSDRARQRWRKVGTRSAQAIAKASVGILCETNKEGTISRIGFGAGSVAPTVLPLSRARALVLGKRPEEIDLCALDQAVDRDTQPIDDLRSTAQYRRHVVKAVVRSFIEETAQVRNLATP